MIDRRMYLVGGLGLIALGCSEALRPRRRLTLLKKGTIDQAMPAGFGTWTSEAVSGLVSPEQAGRLANALYSEMVSRAYYDHTSGATAFVLVAYGDTQSDLLQLHRPESCYPAVGFNLKASRPIAVPLGIGAALPGRQVTAVMEERVENIVYWTRLGERLPQDAKQQRMARLENAMEGYVADGILVRCSIVGDPDRSFGLLDRFVPELVSALPKDSRSAFIGSALAQRMA